MDIKELRESAVAGFGKVLKFHLLYNAAKC